MLTTSRHIHLDGRFTLSIVLLTPHLFPKKTIKRQLSMKSYRFKVVMIGDSGVGKTALVSRMTEDSFNQAHVPTIGSQFSAIPQNIRGRQAVLEVWDTAGQEVYRSLVNFYTREAKGAFLAFDVTSLASFQSLSGWVDFINESKDVKIILVANKCDLDAQRAVDSETVRQFAASKGIEVFETSALTGQGVSDAFGKMAEVLLENAGDLDEGETIPVNLTGQKQGKRCC